MWKVSDISWEKVKSAGPSQYRSYSILGSIKLYWGASDSIECYFNRFFLFYTLFGLRAMSFSIQIEAFYFMTSLTVPIVICFKK